MNRNNALVAVSTGLLHAMSQDEVEAVLGHEMSHVANGDMVTLTLIQGVLNTFVMFLARVVGYAIDQAVFRRGSDEQRGPGIGYYITVIVRSGERRVGKEWVSTGRSRWSPCH